MKVLFLLIVSLCLFTACNSGPSIWEVKYKQAVSADLSDENENAISLALEAIEHKPDYYEAHILLGNLYQKIQKWANAVEIFQKANSLKPLKATPLLGIGKSYLEIAAQTEEEDEAERNYRTSQYHFGKVLDLASVSEEEVHLTQEEQFLALRGKGICLLERTLVEDARSFLKQALELNPEDTDTRFYNAKIHEIGMGPNKVSFNEYKKILKENPKHLKTLLAMGDFYRRLDSENKEAIRPYYQNFLDSGGISKRVNEWLKGNSASSEEQVVKYSVARQVKICDICGRIYPLSHPSSICDHDGGNLIIQNE